MLVKFMTSEDGQSLIEYSLIISLIVLVAVGSLILFGEQMISLYEKNKNQIVDSLGGK